MAKLTDGQEKFVQELIKGKSQREAYRTAYPNSRKWKDNAEDVNASMMFNSVKVKLRYEQLHDRLLEEKVLSLPKCWRFILFTRNLRHFQAL